MAISKIKSGAINDDAITNAKLADDAVSSAEIADNIELSGTEALRVPVGTTAQRANAQSGDIRFNSTLSLMEYYDGNVWKSIDSPPTVSSVSPSTFDASGDTITVNGSNFQTGVNVTLIASDGGTYTPDSITRVSDTQLTFNISSSIVADPDDPFDVKIENASGLSVTSSDALTVQGTLSANTSGGSLGTVYDSSRSSLSYDLGVTDSSSESDVTFTYSISSGALPSGLSFNTSTGAVTGTASAVGSDTTSNFTITATGSDASDSSYAETLATAYSLTIAAPVVTSYTSTGSGTFSVPTGVTQVDALVVAGGGGGGARGGGGGGAGGLIYRPAFPVTPGGSVSYTVGTGGRRATMVNGTDTVGAENGTDSIFGTLTAKGGGHGGNQSGSPVGPNANGGAGSGGSGGGSHQNVYETPGSQNSMPNNATQPLQPGDSGTYGFGNQGGSNSNPSSGHGASHPALGGGGGGAGQAGTPGNTPGPTMGKGGDGRSYDISGSSVTYAGGGGAGNHPPFPSQLSYSQGGSGGGGNGGPFPASGGSSGQDGTANRGGGGGGCTTDGNTGTHYGGTGGTGVIIIKY